MISFGGFQFGMLHISSTSTPASRMKQSIAVPFQGQRSAQRREQLYDSTAPCEALESQPAQTANLAGTTALTVSATKGHLLVAKRLSAPRSWKRSAENFDPLYLSPSLGRTQRASFLIASSASGATPARKWKTCCMSG